MLVTVIGLNGLLSLCVCWLAYRLWRWRYGLVQLNHWLLTAQQRARSAPPQIGYDLALKRTQLAKVRLGLSRWQLRSRQLRQLLHLIRLLRRVWLFRQGQLQPARKRPKSP